MGSHDHSVHNHIFTSSAMSPVLGVIFVPQLFITTLSKFDIEIITYFGNKNSHNSLLKDYIIRSCSLTNPC
ncbi:hypothetical protein RIR_jg11495.t1 [Rhizophagus irregularis DAOM 181602=DAOM 197198]|nr:hypothetical protein RIR_jg11495.t1 [Rhizophagus irregularis DAOM 181602=DAOM 197198]